MKNKDNDKQELAGTDKNTKPEEQTTKVTNWGADEIRPDTDAEGNDIVGSGLGIDE